MWETIRKPIKQENKNTLIPKNITLIFTSNYRYFVHLNCNIQIKWNQLIKSANTGHPSCLVVWLESAAQLFGDNTGYSRIQYLHILEHLWKPGSYLSLERNSSKREERRLTRWPRGVRGDIPMCMYWQETHECMTAQHTWHMGWEAVIIG